MGHHLDSPGLTEAGYSQKATQGDTIWAVTAPIRERINAVSGPQQRGDYWVFKEFCDKGHPGLFQSPEILGKTHHKGHHAAMQSGETLGITAKHERSKTGGGMGEGNQPVQSLTPHAVRLLCEGPRSSSTMELIAQEVVPGLASVRLPSRH